MAIDLAALSADPFGPGRYTAGATGLDIPAIPPIPEDDGSLPSEADIDTAAEGGDEAPKPKSLQELLAEHPEAAKEFEGYVPQSEIERVRTESAAQAVATNELVGLRARQDALVDRITDEADPTKLANYRAELKQVRTELNAKLGQQTEAQVREMAYIKDALKNLYGLSPTQLAAMPQFKSYAEMQAWVKTESPVVQSWVKDAMDNAKADGKTVASAGKASQFGARLAATPAPNVGASSGAAPKNSRTFDQVEADWLQGKVSFQEYTQARARNPRLGVRV